MRTQKVKNAMFLFLFVKASSYFVRNNPMHQLFAIPFKQDTFGSFLETTEKHILV